VASTAPTVIHPRADAHEHYARLYEEGYLLFQAPLRQFGQSLVHWN
jgi:hypothetical protein